jgi:hypothetical protein
VRASDFIKEDVEDSDRDNTLLTVLSLISDKVKDGKIKSDLPVEFVLRPIQNAGLVNFTLDDLKDANDQIPAIQNIIKQITNDKITFVSDDSTPVTNTPDYEGAVDNPEQTVSNMAKSAMKRRQN